MPRKPRPLAERFRAFLTPGDPDACWPWMGARDSLGYGCVWTGTKAGKAYRVAYEMAHGPIPDGGHVMHTCDNPPCCNPAHLRLGSHLDNMRDKERKGRGGQKRGEEQGLSKLTEIDVRAIRLLHAQGTLVSDLARHYGVSYGTARAVVLRWTWKHVP